MFRVDVFHSGHAGGMAGAVPVLVSLESTP